MYIYCMVCYHMIAVQYIRMVFVCFHTFTLLLMIWNTLRLRAVLTTQSFFDDTLFKASDYLFFIC